METYPRLPATTPDDGIGVGALPALAPARGAWPGRWNLALFQLTFHIRFTPASGLITRFSVDRTVEGGINASAGIGHSIPK